MIQGCVRILSALYLFFGFLSSNLKIKSLAEQEIYFHCCYGNYILLFLIFSNSRRSSSDSKGGFPLNLAMKAFLQDIGDDAKRPKVYSIIVGYSFQDFRRKIHRGSTSSSHHLLVGQLSEPEISYFKDSFLVICRPENILGLFKSTLLLWYLCGRCYWYGRSQAHQWWSGRSERFGSHLNICANFCLHRVRHPSSIPWRCRRSQGCRIFSIFRWCWDVPAECVEVYREEDFALVHVHFQVLLAYFFPMWRCKYLSMTLTAKGELSPMKMAFLTYAKAPLLENWATRLRSPAVCSCRRWRRFVLNPKSYIQSRMRVNRIFVKDAVCLR